MHNAALRGRLEQQRYWLSEPTQSRWITLTNLLTVSMGARKQTSTIVTCLLWRKFSFCRIPSGLKYHNNMKQTLVRNSIAKPFYAEH